MTPAARGGRSSMRSRPSRSGRSRSRLRIRMSSTWEAARACIDRTCRWATASTVPRTRAGPGLTSASPMPSRSPSWPWIRTTRAACSPRCSVIPSVRIPSAASTARSTAASRGSGCSTRIRTPAAPRSRSTRAARTSCTPRCGSRVSAPGRTRTSSRAREAGCSSRPTAARPGSPSRQGFLPISSRSTSRSRPARRSASMPPRAPASPAIIPRRPDLACSARTTPARAGCASLPIRGRRCASAAATCPCCASIRRTPTSFTARASSR